MELVSALPTIYKYVCSIPVTAFKWPENAYTLQCSMVFCTWRGWCTLSSARECGIITGSNVWNAKCDKSRKLTSQ